LKDTVGGLAGPDVDTADAILFRSPANLMDEPLPPFTGDKAILWPSGYDEDGYQTYYNDQPLPATVIAFLPKLHTQD